jgi:hypothetical protein
MEPAEVPLSRVATHLGAVPLELSVILGYSYKVEKKKFMQGKLAKYVNEN